MVITLAIAELIRGGADFNLTYNSSDDALKEFAKTRGDDVIARMDEFIEGQEDKKNISMTPYDIAVVMGHKEVIKVLDKKNEKDKALKVLREDLIIKINKLENYCDALIKEAATQSLKEEDKVIELAKNLKGVAIRYIESVKAPENRSELDIIQAEFKKILDEGGDTLMVEHRALWEPILLNIETAATDIGLLHSAYKYHKTGSTFFENTDRQKKVQVIGDLLDTKPADDPSRGPK